MKNFQPSFFERLRQQMQYERFAPDLASRYPKDELIFFPTNNDKRMIGILNQRIRDLKYSIPYWKEQGLPELAEMNYRLNQAPIGPKNYFFPIDRMKQWLAGQPATE